MIRNHHKVCFAWACDASPMLIDEGQESGNERVGIQSFNVHYEMHNF